MQSVQHAGNGSVTMSADEVRRLREVLHRLQQTARRFAGKQGNEIDTELVRIRRDLGSDFYGP